MARGRTREAVIAYERALKLDPKFKEALANLAQVSRGPARTLRAGCRWCRQGFGGGGGSPPLAGSPAAGAARRVGLAG